MFGLFDKTFGVFLIKYETVAYMELCIYGSQHFILLWLNPFSLGLIRMDGGLSTLCHSCGFACQQRVLKTYRGPGYLHTWICRSDYNFPYKIPIYDLIFGLDYETIL